MEFTVSKAVLLKELTLLQGVVEKKSTIPILSNVLLETSGNSLLSLVATDLDVSLATECSADVVREGSMVLQARKLFDIVRNLPEADIRFTKQENDWAKVTCGNSEFRVVGQAREHFPSTPKFPSDGVSIPGSVLCNLIVRTIYGITQEESRYALNGSLFLLSEGHLHMVATDGHRLAFVAATEAVVTDDESKQVRVIIPKKALIELQRLTTASEESVKFSIDENHIYFALGPRRLTSRMLAGQFPNFELVMPKNNDKMIQIGADKIGQAIRRVALMADERSHGVKFHLSASTLQITSQSADVGEAKEVLPIDYDGDSFSIGFNAQYLLDFLGAVGTDEVVIELKDEQSPALMRPPTPDGYDYKYVVMPMRLV
jgi:DNA polymerase-3 subunit beta